MHIVEQVRGKVRGSPTEGTTAAAWPTGSTMTTSLEWSESLALSEDSEGLRDQVNGSLGVISRDLISRGIIWREHSRPSTTTHWLRLRDELRGKGKAVAGIAL